MSSSWKGGSTRRWRTIRAGVLARDGHACRIRSHGVCIGTASHAHHLHGKAHCRGCANDDPTHLVAACAPCNLHIGDPGRNITDPPARPVTNWRKRP